MKLFTPPDIYDGEGRALFIAGGITDCPDWQDELASKLKEEEVILYNPRRKDSKVDTEELILEQIRWEHDHLRKADAISFWFPKETLCPITLYELGTWSASKKPIFVGVHPKYKRRKDVEIQTKLVRPEIKIVYDLDSLSGQIKDWIKA